MTARQQPLIFALLATASALQHPPFLARAHQQMPLLSRRSPPKVSFAATPRVAVAPCCTAANQTGAARPSLRTPNFSLLKRLRVPLLLSILLCAFFTQFTRGLLSCYHAYEAAAIARPLVTKAATSGVAYFLGDAIAQRFSPARVDRGRLARATIAGTVSHGPQLHFWTLALEHILPGAGWRPLLGKIALDQLIFSLYINAGACLHMRGVHVPAPCCTRTLHARGALHSGRPRMARGSGLVDNIADVDESFVWQPSAS